MKTSCLKSDYMATCAQLYSTMLMTFICRLNFCTPALRVVFQYDCEGEVCGVLAGLLQLVDPYTGLSWSHEHRQPDPSAALEELDTPQETKGTINPFTGTQNNHHHWLQFLKPENSLYLEHSVYIMRWEPQKFGSECRIQAMRCDIPHKPNIRL